MEEQPGGWDSGTSGNETWEIVVSDEVLRRDYLFDALSHPKRRFICIRLGDEAGEDVQTLARQLAHWEGSGETDDITASDIQQARIALEHVHIPKLEELSVVIHDTDTDMVLPGPRAEAVVTALTAIAQALDSESDQ